MLIIYIYFVLKIITKHFNLITSMFGIFSNNYELFKCQTNRKKNGGVNRWAYARVYSAVMGGKARKYDIDHLIKNNLKNINIA